MPSLLDMPDIAMKLILEKSDFLSIQNLRKSCRDLRHFIDDVKPESQLSQIYIQQDLYQIHLTLEIDHRNFNITYQKWDGGCKVKKNRVSEKILKDADFLEVACKDIELILDSSQKSNVIEKFEVYLMAKLKLPVSKLVDNLEKILEPRNLKVKKLKIHSSEGHETVMKFLPFLDAKTLEDIILRLKRHNLKFEFSEISTLEQWKNAKKLVMNYYFVPTEGFSILNFVHFREVNMEIQGLTMQMVVDLKKAFFANKNMESFEIGFQEYQVSFQQLDEFLGISSIPRQSKWFFRIPETSETFLSIRFNDDDQVCFKRVESGAIPQNAIIY